MLCDNLVVGVYSDSTVESCKSHKPVINEHDRREIVEAIKCVDVATICETRDKKQLWNKYHFDVFLLEMTGRGRNIGLFMKRNFRNRFFRSLYAIYEKHIHNSDPKAS